MKLPQYTEKMVNVGMINGKLCGPGNDIQEIIIQLFILEKFFIPYPAYENLVSLTNVVTMIRTIFFFKSDLRRLYLRQISTILFG